MARAAQGVPRGCPVPTQELPPGHAWGELVALLAASRPWRSALPGRIQAPLPSREAPAPQCCRAACGMDCGHLCGTVSQNHDPAICHSPDPHAHLRAPSGRGALEEASSLPQGPLWRSRPQGTVLTVLGHTVTEPLGIGYVTSNCWAGKMQVLAFPTHHPPLSRWRGHSCTH